MENKFYTSTNWAPWLGLGFLLSTIFFGTINDTWLMVLLVILSFLPALMVKLTLKGYFLVNNFQVKYCYDRQHERSVSFSIPIVDIISVKRIGKSVLINHTVDKTSYTRVHEAETFVNLLLKYNPRITILT
jgi:hypothetical protein